MSTTTSNLGLFKYDTTNPTDLASAFNINTALNNNWDIIDEAISNSCRARNIGEIVASTVPLTDAGLHLLDGTRLSGDGIYSDFVDYMATLYGDGTDIPHYFYKTSEKQWSAPELTSNGTIGVDNFAVKEPNGTSSQYYPWMAFNPSTDTTNVWVSSSNNPDYIVYSSTPIKISNIQIRNRNLANYVRGIRSGTVYGSTDGTTYTLINSFTNSNYGANSTWSIDLSNNKNYYTYYKFSLVGDGEFAAIAKMDLTATYKQSAEEQWQQSVAQYGVCGKFVYDSVNNTVRLPKITGKLDGTTDINALGDLEPLFIRLPNIIGAFNPGNHDPQASGAFYSTWNGSREYSSEWQGHRITLDASRSSSVYSGNGSDTTIHEQAINILLYIVIATSTKTDIEVDIDNVVSDLNGKADTNLSNIDNQAKILMSGMGMPSGTYTELPLGASGTTYTAPANGWFTAKILNPIQWSNFSLYNTITLLGYTLVFTTNHGTADYHKLSIPAKKGDIIKVQYTGTLDKLIFIYAQGSESEAS